MDKPKARRSVRPIHLLLLVPFAASLWTPFYNRAEPSLAGIPFFYWYQLAWIVIAALILAAVYLGEGSDRA